MLQVVAVAIPCSIVLFLIILGTCVYISKTRTHNTTLQWHAEERHDHLAELWYYRKYRIDPQDVVCETLVAQGGEASVFLGNFRGHTGRVAIKVANVMHGQESQTQQVWQDQEVKVLSSSQHRRLVIPNHSPEIVQLLLEPRVAGGIHRCGSCAVTMDGMTLCVCRCRRDAAPRKPFQNSQILCARVHGWPLNQHTAVGPQASSIEHSELSAACGMGQGHRSRDGVSAFAQLGTPVQRHHPPLVCIRTTAVVLKESGLNCCLCRDLKSMNVLYDTITTRAKVKLHLGDCRHSMKVLGITDCRFWHDSDDACIWSSEMG